MMSIKSNLHQFIMSQKTILIQPIALNITKQTILQQFKQFDLRRISFNKEHSRAYVEFTKPAEIEALAERYVDCKVQAFSNAEIGFVQVGFIWPEQDCLTNVNEEFLVVIKNCAVKDISDEIILKTFQQFSINKFVKFEETNEIVIEFRQKSDLQLLDKLFINSKIQQFGIQAKIDVQSVCCAKRFADQYEKQINLHKQNIKVEEKTIKPKQDQIYLKMIEQQKLRKQIQIKLKIQERDRELRQDKQRKRNQLLKAIQIQCREKEKKQKEEQEARQKYQKEQKKRKQEEDRIKNQQQQVQIQQKIMRIQLEMEEIAKLEQAKRFTKVPTNQVAQRSQLIKVIQVKSIEQFQDKSKDTTRNTRNSKQENRTQRISLSHFNKQNHHKDQNIINNQIQIQTKQQKIPQTIIINQRVKNHSPSTVKLITFILLAWTYFMLTK